jgi:hypothetical protein
VAKVKAAAGPARPQRTKEHINADKSNNYIEKFFIDKGHTVERPGADYGYDVLVNTYLNSFQNGAVQVAAARPVF